MKTPVLALLLSACMFGQQSGPTAASQGSTIHGVLIGQDGQPAKKITVAALWICPARSKTCRISEGHAVTDQNGEFRFNRVGIDKYAVFAEDREAEIGRAHV